VSNWLPFAGAVLKFSPRYHQFLLPTRCLQFWTVVILAMPTNQKKWTSLMFLSCSRCWAVINSCSQQSTASCCTTWFIRWYLHRNDTYCRRWWMLLASRTELSVSVVDCVWNMMAHAQKPDFVFRRNGQVHLNRPGGGGGVGSVDDWRPGRANPR